MRARVLRNVLAALLCLFLSSAPAVVSGHSIQAGDWLYVLDEGYSVDDVRDGDMVWQTSPWKAPNLGFTSEPYWFRLSLSENELAEGVWYLWIHNAILTEMQFFVHKRGETEPVLMLGGMRMPVYPIHIENDTQYTLYLWVKSDTALQIPAEIISDMEFLTKREQQDSLFGIFVGILFSMMLYNFVLYLTIRDKTFLLYVGHSSALLFFVCSWQGLGNAYIWNGYSTFQNMSIGLATFSVIGFSTWFCGVFLGINASNFKLNRVYWAVRDLGFVGVVVTPFIPSQWAIFSSSFLSFFAVLMVINAMFSRAKLSYRPARLFVMGWTMYVTGAFVMGLNKFGVIEVNQTSENLLLWGAVFDMVLLCIALGDKFHEERNIKIKAQEMAIKAVKREKNAKETAIAKQKQSQAALEEAARAQRNYALVLERRVKERSLELKRAQLELEHVSEQDALTNLKNRRFFIEQLESHILLCQEKKRAFAILLVDIDNFKTVNDSHGHLAGDECIRSTGKLLQEKLKREDEVVCRYGGEEFVIIMPCTSEGDAVAMAESLRSHVAKCPMLCEGQRIMVTISIGVLMVTDAVLPELADNLIAQADQALYQAKSQGRNCVCVA
ncbi:MAG: sensor domain-containing diguanylate cyclase [Ketobacter sp.]|nr:sensor domain-containing diguanylate cyclase [Ketobacter sp.]